MSLAYWHRNNIQSTRHCKNIPDTDEITQLVERIGQITKYDHIALYSSTSWKEMGIQNPSFFLCVNNGVFTFHSDEIPTYPVDVICYIMQYIRRIMVDNEILTPNESLWLVDGKYQHIIPLCNNNQEEEP